MYEAVHAEISLDADGNAHGVNYGQAGTTRLDVLEQVSPGSVCVYDVKTGRGLSPKRVQQIAALVARKYGAVSFFIVEVRPVE